MIIISHTKIRFGIWIIEYHRIAPIPDLDRTGSIVTEILEYEMWGYVDRYMIFIEKSVWQRRESGMGVKFEKQQILLE